MNEVTRAKLRDALHDHEGRLPFFYADTRGNVTIGVGHLVTSVQAIIGLGVNFWHSDGTKAVLSEVTAAFAAVRHSQKPAGNVTLHDPDIDIILDNDIDKALFTLRNTFPGLALPEPAELALADMAFNLGSFHAFPHLVAAVRAHDWVTAAAECERRGIGAERNTYTRQLLLEAAAAEPKEAVV